jgi:aminoglycoside phosphotransferase (APT) family kinase protein
VSAGAVPGRDPPRRSLDEWLGPTSETFARSLVRYRLTAGVSLGRNVRVRVETSDRGGELVKLAPAGSAVLASEAALLAALEAIGPLRHASVPEIVGSREPRSATEHARGGPATGQGLVIRLIPGATSLRQAVLDSTGWEVRVFATLGRALGELHAIPSGALSKRELPPFQPWILRMLAPPRRTYEVSSAGQLAFLKRLQAVPAIEDLFERVRSASVAGRRRSIVHGDLKWDNVLVRYPSETNDEPRVWLVDWEFAGAGDPLWDAGTFLSEFLALWALSIPITGGSPLDHYAALAAYPLDDMQPAIRSFWNAYVDQMRVNPVATRSALIDATRLCGLRLLQTVYERLQGSLEMSLHMFLLLQLGLNIMADPESAAEGLLGLPGPSESGT